MTADTVPMEKRTLLWSLGLIAFGFAYLAAANVGQTGPFGSTICRTFNPFLWFTRSCSDLLFERLGVLAIGGAVLLVCGYFAEKAAPPASELMGGHPVRFDANRAVWACQEEGCRFVSATRAGARRHAAATGGHPIAKAASVGNQSLRPAVPDLPQPPAPEFKSCPDCAEQVRAAARKCRFCGYEFTTA